MSQTVLNNTSGSLEAYNTMPPSTSNPQFDEVSVKILLSCFKTDVTSAREAVKWIESKREELASYTSLKFRQLNGDAASHLLRDHNLSAACDRAFGNFDSTRGPHNPDTVLEQGNIFRSQTGSSISFPIQGPGVEIAPLSPYSDSGLKPRRPTVSSTNSVAGMVERHVKCKRVGCKGKIMYKTRRGLREHMILEHRIPEEQANIQAEFAFSDRQLNPDHLAPRIPGVPYLAAETPECMYEQGVMQQSYWTGEVGAQFQPPTSPIVTVTGEGTQQAEWPVVSNYDWLSPYSRSQKSSAARAVTPARPIIDQDSQNPSRTMQASPLDPDRQTSTQRVPSTEMPNRNSQASFRAFQLSSPINSRE